MQCVPLTVVQILTYHAAWLLVNATFWFSKEVPLSLLHHTVSHNLLALMHMPCHMPAIASCRQTSADS